MYKTQSTREERKSGDTAGITCVFLEGPVSPEPTKADEPEHWGVERSSFTDSRESGSSETDVVAHALEADTGRLLSSKPAWFHQELE